MTITQLSTFLKIAELNSFSAAAGSMGYAQSTVTTQIKLLEEELNCRLFDRLGKTIVLTPQGEKLITYAEKMLQLEREIHLEISDEEEPTGVLKIGVSESLCYSYVPQALMNYRNQIPGIDIRPVFITHDTFPDMLQKGELDLVYTLNPYIDDDRLTMLHKKAETLGFYASPNHPLSGKKVTEKDLTDYPLLVTGQNCSFRSMLLSDLEGHNVEPKILIETESKEILKQFASNGLGIAFIPDMTATREVKNKSLKRLDWRGDSFPIYSQIFVHKDKHISRAISSLVDVIKSEAARN
ncbi:LysR family transcriptional regulator [Butyrivibrio sp. FCS014]|uniref:LysR family transcriptional regulator n=1 Tax=Butyrivibrio sp. FCS014 TaxID=1408304 RepID=UPI0004646D23|nr:LysR family transcriptional regulator [Butyrivibrio sp. FCS014]